MHVKFSTLVETYRQAYITPHRDLSSQLTEVLEATEEGRWLPQPPCVGHVHAPVSPHRDPDDLHVDTAVGALCLHPTQLISSSGPWGPLPPSLTAPPSSFPGLSFPHPAPQAQLLEPGPRGLSLPSTPQVSSLVHVTTHCSCSPKLDVPTIKLQTLAPEMSCLSSLPCAKRAPAPCLRQF